MYRGVRRTSLSQRLVCFLDPGPHSGCLVALLDGAAKGDQEIRQCVDEPVLEGCSGLEPGGQLLSLGAAQVFFLNGLGVQKAHGGGKHVLLLFFIKIQVISYILITLYQ